MKKVKREKTTRKAKKFHLGDILSITAGPLVSPRHMMGVADILSFMVGESLFDCQLPRVADECRPYLLKQHPQLKKIDASDVTKYNWQEWLDEQIENYGERLPVKPIPKRSQRGPRGQESYSGT